MVCHSVCGADDMTDVTIWQKFPLIFSPFTSPPHHISTLGSHNARRGIFIPKVRWKYACTCVTPSP